MKVSGFTFIKNPHMLGYPFIESIHSILPIVDEFVIALGPCKDETERMIKDIGEEKIKIIHTQWNEKMQNKGFVYAQQSNIALNNCTGDWAFYLQSDEIVHEKDLPEIRKSMQYYLNDDEVEALVFEYRHFYGNPGTYAWSPAWYRRECRVVKNTEKILFPSDGQCFVIQVSNRRGRYPRAALANATIYHYGWVRNEGQMNLKMEHVGKYWDLQRTSEINYADIDATILKEFQGTHPKVIQSWLPQGEGIFKCNPHHRLTTREFKHRISLFIEKILGIDLSIKHYKLVK